MKFDEIILQLGEFGKYQKILYFMLCVPIITCGMMSTMLVFLLGEPEFRCKIPGNVTDEYDTPHDTTLKTLINKYIPPSTDETLTFDQCHLYDIDETTKFDNSSRPINASQIKCNEWVYSRKVFKETFLSKTNAVCDDYSKINIPKTMNFVGVFIGAVVFGLISDVFGRKVSLQIAFVFLSISSLAVAFSPTLAVMSILQVIVGAASDAIYGTAFVIGLELVGPSKRIWTGIVISYFNTCGILLNAGIGYLVRDWKYIEIIAATPSFLYLSYWWFIPESPRWLLNRGKIKKAEAVLQKAAKVNNVNLNIKNLLDVDDEDDKPIGKIWHLFTSRVLLVRTLILFFNWCVITMTYFGLSYYTGNLGGNFYLNFLISGLVEFPANTLTLIFLDRLGRKRLHCISMLLGGIACVCTIFPILYGGEDLQYVTVALAMVGKLGATAAFGIIYVFSAELYPTVVRNSALGASSCIGNIGGILAPIIADSGKAIGGKMGQSVPLLVFGTASIVAGLLSLWLPETLNQRLPETIKDWELFGTLSYYSGNVEAHVNETFNDNEENNAEL